MKYFYFIIVIIYFLSCSDTVMKQKVVGLKVKTELKGCFNLPLKEDFYLINNDSSLYFLIDFKIINESEQTIEFITYSCTSVENLLVDNKSVRIVINRCSGNGPMIVELRPKQEFSLPVIIQTNIRNAFTYVNVGWILIDRESGSIKSFHDLSKTLSTKRISHDDIIWGDSVYLDASGGKPFEVK